MKAAMIAGTFALAFGTTTAGALDLPASPARGASTSDVVFIGRNTGCGTGKTFDFKSGQCRTVTSHSAKPRAQQRKEEAQEQQASPPKKSAQKE